MKIKTLILTTIALAGVTSSSAHALTSRNKDMAYLIGTLDSVAQHCTQFEPNPFLSNSLVPYTTGFSKEEIKEFGDEMRDARALVLEGIKEGVASDFCEAIYQELLGPSGKVGEKSAIWLMKR